MDRIVAAVGVGACRHACWPAGERPDQGSSSAQRLPRGEHGGFTRRWRPGLYKKHGLDVDDPQGRTTSTSCSTWSAASSTTASNKSILLFPTSGEHPVEAIGAFSREFARVDQPSHQGHDTLEQLQGQADPDLGLGGKRLLLGEGQSTATPTTDPPYNFNSAPFPDKIGAAGYADLRSRSPSNTREFSRTYPDRRTTATSTKNTSLIAPRSWCARGRRFVKAFLEGTRSRAGTMYLYGAPKPSPVLPPCILHVPNFQPPDPSSPPTPPLLEANDWI